MLVQSWSSVTCSFVNSKGQQPNSHNSVYCGRTGTDLILYVISFPFLLVRLAFFTCSCKFTFCLNIVAAQNLSSTPVNALEKGSLDN
jgi:hypothetical protein